MNDESLNGNPLDSLAEEFVARFRRGERPALTEFTIRHPELADDIRELFPALVMMEEARPGHAAAIADFDRGGPRSPAGQRLERLGDYRILREVGRGGMGIVYEAEQESLGRHVALKVLPAHAMLDPRQLQRFQREARAAGRLHHTNIVPVFGVGQHDGLNYFVMQFIPGLGLDQVLDELRRLRKEQKPDASAREHQQDASLTRRATMASATHIAASLIGQTLGVDHRGLAHFATESAEQNVPVPLDAQPSGASDSATFRVRSPSSDPSGSGIHLLARDTTSLSTSGFQYWQSVARIGVQVAEAIDYAFSQGVLHRDIKPSNLLLDAHGTVWVTDFGLAKSADSDDLTHTGDVVGTLRYLAPERLRGEVHLRGDLYSLGVTLYEMLTLRPPFLDHDRSRLVRRIADEEPTRPRHIDATIPRDLETIVMKAIAKDPVDRYRSAADMADDLRQFLEDKPIKARPIGQLERAWRWCRRNPRVAVLTASVALLLVAVTGISTVAALWLKEERDAARRAESKAKAAESVAVRANEEQSKAEAGRRRELSRAYLNEAKNFLHGRFSGQRVHGLDRIQRVIATLRPDELDEWHSELRDAAISHLALPDVDQIAGTPIPLHRGDVAVHPSFEYFAVSDVKSSGTVIRKMDDPSFSLELESLVPNGPHELVFHTLRVFSPSGRWLAEVRPAEGDAKVLLVWDWRERKQVCQPRPSGYVRPTFHPNDRELVFDAVQKNARLDIPRDTIVSESSNNQLRTSRSAFSADGRLLAIYSHEFNTTVVDGQTFELLARLNEMPNVDSAAWHPTEPTLVLGDLHGRRYVWNHAERTGRFPFTPWIGAINSSEFSSDGRYFARSGANNVIEIRQTDSDKGIVSLTGEFLRFQPGASRFATRTSFGELQYWEIVECESLVHVNQWCRAATFSPDGRWLATAGDLGTQVYETRSWQRAADLGLDPSGPVTFHPDGTGLLTFGMYTHAQRWPITPQESSASTWRLGPPQPLVQHKSMTELLSGFELLPQHFGRTSAISADGRVIVLADARNHKILINDSQQPEIFQEFAPFRLLRKVAITPDGKWIAAAAENDRQVGVFDAASREQVLHLSQHANAVFSQDGRYLATTSPNELRLYRVGSWELAQTVALPRVSNWDAAPVGFQPGGRLLAVGDSFFATRLLDRETGTTLATLMHSPTESSHLFGLEFSPDGSRLAVTRGYDDVCVWDLAQLNAELKELGLDLTELPDRRDSLREPTLARGEIHDNDAPKLTVDRGDKLIPATDWHKFWVRLAQGEMLQRRWPDAIDDLTRGMQQHIPPTGIARAEMLRLRATCNIHHGDFTAARNDLQESLTLDRGHAEPIRQLARLLLLGPPELRDPNQAIGLLSGLPADPNPSVEDTALLGMAQVRVGHHEEGLATLEKVADAEALRAHVALFQAIAHWHLGHPDVARLAQAVAATVANDSAADPDPNLILLKAEVAELLGQANTGSPVRP